MKILVIDDDPEVLQTLATFFQSEGHEVITAENGNQGKAAAFANLPDLAFIDMKLPDADGIELLKEIKDKDKYLTAVIMTAYKDAEKVVTAFRNGAFDCLLKPFNFDYLRNNIIARVPRRIR
jgi:DNA-binding NtrC family response regulator